MFGQKCLETSQGLVASILDVEKTSFEEKYLGLPMPEGRMKDSWFQSIKGKYTKRLTIYDEKYMSSGAKEVLIKSVLQALPTYAMGIFKFSYGLCDDLMQLIRNFWWGDKENEKKVHWISWEKMIAPKCYGGMGFRDMRAFN
jgi:hypothetical protein